MQVVGLMFDNNGPQVRPLMTADPLTADPLLRTLLKTARSHPLRGLGHGEISVCTAWVGAAGPRILMVEVIRNLVETKNFVGIETKNLDGTKTTKS